MKNELSSPRRDFLKTVTLSSFGLAVLPAIDFKFEQDIGNNFTITFQGDSITDAGRSRARYYANDSAGLGNGYVTYIAGHLLGNNPDKNIKCYNRGISGNKVYQLSERWNDDCLNLRPDVLSILIGVNDFWHTLSHNYQGTADTYETDFRQLLDRTKASLPDTKLIIGEPFAVKGGTAITDEWRSGFVAYQQAAKTIAKDYNAIFIPYQNVFDEALEKGPVSYWCPDGVHPSVGGAFLMATAWIDAFNNLR